jgi:hypothetical protein
MATNQPAQKKTSAAANAQRAASQPEPATPTTNSGEVILQIRGNSAFESTTTDTTAPKKRRRRRKKSAA